MPTILVFGGGGKLGSALVRALGDLGRIVAPPSAEVDARDAKCVDRVLDAIRPDLVVNAAAMLGIDACEREPELALHLNALFPRQLARWTAGRGARLLHISSDAVFADSDGSAYDEDSATAPLNLYGATKAMGDHLIAAEGGRHLICRCPLIFGPSRQQRQFCERMLERMRAGEPVLRVATDIVCCPSFSGDLAAAMRDLIADDTAHGLYHLANAGQASLYELVTAIRDESGLDARMEPARAADFPGLGRRNLRTPIISRRVPPLRPWREALRDWLASVPVGAEVR